MSDHASGTRDANGSGSNGSGPGAARPGPRRGLLVAVFAGFYVLYWLASTAVFTTWVNDVGGFVWAFGILALPVVVPLYGGIQRLAFKRRPGWRQHGWRFLGLACLLTAVLYPGIAAGIATLGASFL